MALSLAGVWLISTPVQLGESATIIERPCLKGRLRYVTLRWTMWSMVSVHLCYSTKPKDSNCSLLNSKQLMPSGFAVRSAQRQSIKTIMLCQRCTHLAQLASIQTTDIRLGLTVDMYFFQKGYGFTNAWQTRITKTYVCIHKMLL